MLVIGIDLAWGEGSSRRLANQPRSSPSSGREGRQRWMGHRAYRDREVDRPVREPGHDAHGRCPLLAFGFSGNARLPGGHARSLGVRCDRHLGGRGRVPRWWRLIACGASSIVDGSQASGQGLLNPGRQSASRPARRLCIGTSPWMGHPSRRASDTLVSGFLARTLDAYKQIDPRACPAGRCDPQRVPRIPPSHHGFGS